MTHFFKLRSISDLAICIPIYLRTVLLHVTVFRATLSRCLLQLHVQAQSHSTEYHWVSDRNWIKKKH